MTVDELNELNKLNEISQEFGESLLKNGTDKKIFYQLVFNWFVNVIQSIAIEDTEAARLCFKEVLEKVLPFVYPNLDFNQALEALKE